MKVYECIVIGGGPAGLSAAIYLARFNRSVLVIDNDKGRSSYPQHNENYLGFPKGIDAIKLRKLGKKQASLFGAGFQNDVVMDIYKKKKLFYLKGESGAYIAKTVILSTGVTDLFPHFDLWKEYVGRSMFWCITCDGYKLMDRKIAVVGSSNEAACTCLQFLNFTKKIVFITNIDKCKDEISNVWFKRFKKAGIPYYRNCIKKVKGKDGYVSSIILDNEIEIEAEYIVNEQGSIPSYELAKKLGVKLTKDFFIKVSDQQRTNISGFYAAGDVTNHFSHQLVTAAHEGSMAAQSVNYDLYAPFQKI